MKKNIIVLVFLLFSASIFAQKVSMLHPTLVVWKTGTEKYSLNEAKYGVALKNDLSLNVYFHKLYFNRLTNPSELSLEFRWYYYLSTRRSLMYVDKVSYKNAKIDANNVVIFKSVQKNLQPGWWEVRIVNSNDTGFLEIGNISKFQIFIK